MAIHTLQELERRGRQMESLMRTYLDACNEANVEKIAACFASAAVHYFPLGMYEGPFHGAEVIAKKWRAAVEAFGSYWMVDRIMVQPLSYEAVMEWTHFKTKQDTVLRGIEWYDFDRTTGLIKEIRAYYASPQSPDLSTHELGGFAYAERGYSMHPPQGHNKTQAQ